MKLTKSACRTRPMLAATLICGLVGAGPAAATAFTADFNGDGYEDMVVGTTWEKVKDVRAGIVRVVYGDANGRLSPQSETALLNQNIRNPESINLVGVAEDYDGFGHAVAIGDFNHDGYDDLAIGSPGEDIGRMNNAGIINIVYGGPEGLTDQHDHTLSMWYAAGGNWLRSENQLGRSLAVGDFNGDGVDDLAAGFLGNSYGTGYYDSRGGVALFFGRVGLSLNDRDPERHYVSIESVDITNPQPTKFGDVLAAGDFNHDGFDDLAVGATHANSGGVPGAGRVHVAFGVRDWSRRRGATFRLRLDPEHKTRYGRFGWALTAANFNGDDRDELAVGIPYSDISGKRAGAVSVVNFVGGWTTVRAPYYQSQGNIPGKSQTEDEFGYSLTAADFNRDGYADLAIGIPSKSYIGWLRDEKKRGEAVVLKGAPSNLYSAQLWHQDKPGVEGTRERGDNFAMSMSTGDFNNDGYPDLLVGVPLEDLNGVDGAGMVQLFWGHPSAVTTVSLGGQQAFHEGHFSGPGFGIDAMGDDSYFGSRLP